MLAKQSNVLWLGVDEANNLETWSISVIKKSLGLVMILLDLQLVNTADAILILFF